MKRLFLLFACLWALSLQAQPVNPEAFQLLNLDYPGLQTVKSLYDQGETEAAAQALLAYYRNRRGVVNPMVDTEHLTISQREQKWADEALQHTFYVHDGYQPSFNYGQDIDWKYWPVKDNELRWQLHRHKWFTPMGKAYRLSGDERYAREWAAQYLDWIRKNPLVTIDKNLYELTDSVDAQTAAENVRFAWRPLETSHRLQDQINQFTLFITSPSFTPAFLTEMLVNYYRHAKHVSANYSAQGNHLLFEAQRMLAAGAFFPEFKEAATWRESGIKILNEQIKQQVYPDGGQYELDLHYHRACIEIFCKALRMADVNGYRKEFPASFTRTIEEMIEFYIDVCYPDYTNPCFSDAKQMGKQTGLADYKEWSSLFPDNRQIRWMATQGAEGECPRHLSKGFLTSGFFVFRNGWGEDATVMVVKAGPKGEWHCQPDNGTFELWHKGRQLFPDSGSYIYAGEGEVMKWRNWFRQTAVHNTLTLDGRNLETTQSVTKLWQPEGEVQVLVTENPSYPGLTHRRSIFFVEQSYFVIVDEALGEATGELRLHYQLCDGEVERDAKQMMLSSHFEGDSQVKLQCFAPKGSSLVEEEGWYSLAYRQRTPRTAAAIQSMKKDGKPVRFITVICPTSQAGQPADIRAKWVSASTSNPTEMSVEVCVNGSKRRLGYHLEESSK